MRTLMIVARLVYLALILFHNFRGDLATFAMHAPIFIGSLFIPYYASKDSRLYALDIYVVSVFSVSLLINFSPSLLATYGNFFGIDKLFHAAGGFGAAWCAWLFLQREIPRRRILVVSVLASVIAIGAVWEIFEWFLWNLPEPFHIVLDGYEDTILDLVADTLGGLIFLAGALFKKAFKEP